MMASRPRCTATIIRTNKEDPEARNQCTRFVCDEDDGLGLCKLHKKIHLRIEEQPLRIRIPGKTSPRRYRGKGKAPPRPTTPVASNDREVDATSSPLRGEYTRTIVAQTIRGIVYLVDVAPLNKGDTRVNIYATESILREERNPPVIGTYDTVSGEYTFYE